MDDDGTDAVISDQWQRIEARCHKCGGYGEHNGVKTHDTQDENVKVKVVQRHCSLCDETYQEIYIVCRAKRKVRPSDS